MAAVPSRCVMRMPFGVDERGHIAWVSDPVKISRQALISIIATQPHERVMRPDYGVDTKRLLFDQMLPEGIMLKRVEGADKLALVGGEARLQEHDIEGHRSLGYPTRRKNGYRDADECAFCLRRGGPICQGRWPG